MPKDVFPKRTVCKWSREELESVLPLLVQEAATAKYICKKCGRCVTEKQLVCKPVKIGKLKPAQDD